jgi:hypothetical protein
MGRIVRLKHEGTLLHTGNPVLGKFGRVQKSTRPLDPCQLRRDRIRYLELRCKAHLFGTHPHNCSPVVPIRPQDIIQS